MRYATYFSLRPRVDKWGEAPPPPAPTPCVGVRSILVHAFDPPLQDIFLHTPMHTCMTYAMYISLQPYVGRRIRGKCGMPPPPPSRFVYMYALCIRTPFKDSWPCQWIHVSYCMVYDCRSTNTGYTWSEPPPPPPPRRISIRVHAFEPHFKIPGYICQCIRISYTTYIGLDFRSTNKWGEPPPPPPPCGFDCAYAFVYIHVNNSM